MLIACVICVALGSMLVDLQIASNLPTIEEAGRAQTGTSKI